MISRLKDSERTRIPFAALLFDNRDLARSARMLCVILFSLMVAVTLMECVELVILPARFIRWLSIIAAVDGLGLILLEVTERGRTRLASVLLVVSLSVIITVCAATRGGIHTPAATYYLTVVFIAGLLLGERWALFTAVLCCIGGLSLVFSERTANLPPNELRNSAFALWLGIVVNMAVITFLQYLAARTARSAMQQLRMELAERQRAEAAARESEHRYREVFDMTSDCIYLLDVGVNGIFRVERFNPAEEQSVGVTNAEAAGKLVGEFLPHEVATTMNASFQRCVEAGVPIHFEEELNLPVGRRFFDTTLIPVRNDAGEIYRLVGIAHNITERKEAAERLKKSAERLRALSSRLVSLREEERTRISREVHDHLGQLLTALKMEFHALRTSVAATDTSELTGRVTGQIGAATGLINELIGSVQKIAGELRPGILDCLGLEAAIESEAESFQLRTGIECECSVPLTPMDIPEGHATAVFRIFQEILTNVARHAQATRVVVCLTSEEGNLVLEAEDDGVGIKESDIADPKSLGLLGMQERAEILGGTVMFQRTGEQGTIVTFQIPLPAMSLQELPSWEEPETSESAA
ncbi:MAG: putative Hybrid sensor histidine kinase [Pedosphaera sp.]|nr:putative Hybrid sensor histidine kinase [Pedosphaera sp.]